MLESKYDSTEGCYKSIIEQIPEDPLGYFFLAILYHTQIIDYEDYTFEAQYYNYTKQAFEKLKKKTDVYGWNARDYFISGYLNGYRSVLEARKNNWLTGFRYGFKGLIDLQRTVKKDSLFYDAYWGIGVYENYRSKMTNTFSWLPFITDNRQAAIDKVILSMKKGILAKHGAQTTLVWLYYQDEYFEKSLELALDLHHQFPNNRIFLWAVADIYYKLQNWKESLGYYKKLLVLSEDILHDNKYNVIINRWKTANIYYFTNRFEKTIEECNIILQYTLEPKVKKRVKHKLKQTRQLLKKTLQEQRADPSHVNGS